MTSVIQAVVSRALTNGFQSAAFYSKMKEVVQKFVPELLSVDAVATELVDARSLHYR